MARFLCSNNRDLLSFLLTDGCVVGCRELMALWQQVYGGRPTSNRYGSSKHK
jgi:hypothetical protein